MRRNVTGEHRPRGGHAFPPICHPAAMNGKPVQLVSGALAIDQRLLPMPPTHPFGHWFLEIPWSLVICHWSFALNPRHSILDSRRSIRVTPCNAL